MASAQIVPDTIRVFLFLKGGDAYVIRYLEIVSRYIIPRE